MKSSTTQFMVMVGVVILLLIAIGAYFLVTDARFMNEDADTRQTDSMADDPTSVSSEQSTDEMSTTTEEGTEGGFELSDAQVEALIAIGIDPESVPTSISVAQEACFVETLGGERVIEIRNGAIPGPIEFVQAQSCL